MRNLPEPKENKMNAMAQQDEAHRQDETRRRNRLSPELNEFLHMLDALEDHFSRETTTN
jgi:ribulose kinase